jgi:hypothetical protein
MRWRAWESVFGAAAVCSFDADAEADSVDLERGADLVLFQGARAHLMNTHHVLLPPDEHAAAIWTLAQERVANGPAAGKPTARRWVSSMDAASLRDELRAVHSGALAQLGHSEHQTAQLAGPTGSRAVAGLYVRRTVRIESGEVSHVLAIRD